MKSYFERIASVISLLLAVVVIPLACSDGGQNEEDIAKALKNKMSKALDFQGGATIDGAPPEEHAVEDAPVKAAFAVKDPAMENFIRGLNEENQKYPQITSIYAPYELYFEREFYISISSNFANPQEVGGAIVYVDGADMHIKVITQLTGEEEHGHMELLGVLKKDDALAGKDFTIKIALMNNQGEVGNYAIWEVKVVGSHASEGDAGERLDPDQGDGGDSLLENDASEAGREEGGGGSEAGEELESWYDSSSGLSWALTAGPNTMKWQAASDYCESFSSGWRLPTISELKSLVQGCPSSEIGGDCRVEDACLESACWDNNCQGCDANQGADNGCYWPLELEGTGEGTCGLGYWSSSPPNDDDTRAWGINFSTGSIGNYVKEASTLNFRCVRD